mgnify:CR=1 FL=1
MIIIPPIVRPIALSDYAPELGDGQVWVRVNPTRDVLAAYNDLLRRKERIESAGKTAAIGSETDSLIGQATALGNDFADWYSAIWSQGSDPQWHITPDGVRALATHETDPGFYQWLTRRTWEAINEHRSGIKKK